MNKRKGQHRHFHKPPHPSQAPQRSAAEPGGAYWLYGTHAVAAAIANPARRLRRLLATGESAKEIQARPAARRDSPAAPEVEVVERGVLAGLLPPSAVHQGVAALAEPLPATELETLLPGWAAAEPPPGLLVLDQVTDPQNVGAVLRSAAAFGAAAVILTERHAAPESGALAKAASGALELVPLVRVVNLARAIDLLKDAGFWCVGLDAAGTDPLDKAPVDGRVALILGSEGGGLRRLTRQSCDLLVRLPTRGPLRDLNVSNAAAVALYEWARRRP